MKQPRYWTLQLTGKPLHGRICPKASYDEALIEGNWYMAGVRVGAPAVFAAFWAYLFRLAVSIVRCCVEVVHAQLEGSMHSLDPNLIRACLCTAHVDMVLLCTGVVWLHMAGMSDLVLYLIVDAAER